VTPSRFLRIGRQRLRSLFRTRDVDAELDRELAFHLDALVAEKMADGLPEAEARREARRAVGNLTQISEHCRDTRRVGWINDARQDITYGVRLLRAHPGVTMAAVVSLALGIGANVAALRGLDGMRAGVVGVPDADRYVVIQTISPTHEIKGASAIDFAAWRDRSDVFDLLAASFSTPHTVSADALGPAERLAGLSITPSFFETIGARPLLGRAFTREEGRLVDPMPAVIISEQLWRRRFGSDPAILTRHVRLDGVVRPIVGVMPADVWYRDIGVDLWHPLRVLPTVAHGSGRALRVSARLKPGVSIDAARAQLDTIAASVGREFGGGFAGWTVTLSRLDDARLGWSRRPLTILAAIATLVLVVACANVAGLLLARAAARQSEIRLRLDLGASRSRLMRQWITEGVVLGVLGGAAGLAVAWVGLHGLSALRPPPGAPALSPLGLDLRTAAIAAVVSLAAGLCLSVVPAWIASERRRVSTSWPRARSVVTALQVAVTVIIVVGSGLLLNSMIRLSHRDLGFDPDGLVTFEVVVPVVRHNVGTYRNRMYFDVTSKPADTLTRLADAFRAAPNVVSVGGSSFRAVDAFVIPRFDVAASEGSLPAVATAFITPGYFAAMGAAIRQGRDIHASDRAQTPWVAVVNQTAVARLWPGGDPIGRTIRLDTVPDDRPRVVVGVVSDIPLRHALPSEPVVYESYLQQPTRFIAPWINLFGTMTFVVRHNGTPDGLPDALGRAAAGVNPEIPLAGVSLVIDRLAAGRAGLSGLVRLATMLGLTGVLLALVGIHGVVAYGVRRQTREIAVRMALGARPSQVVRLIGGRVGAVIAAGLTAGVLGALPLGRFVGSYLWGVTANDPATYAAACAGIAALAVLACVVPTQHALAIDPALTLRSE
jgi:putative ABC transport system permease protein